MNKEISKLEKKLRQIESGKFFASDRDVKKLEKRLEELRREEK